MAIKPPLRKQTYNHQLPGVYGEFGAGAGLRAFYLQSTIAPSELDRVSLISDISGSERWPVRDLFQRDVDNERVSGGLLPYLQDEGKIKFFNPLTLTVLPMADDGNKVLTELRPVAEARLQDDDQEWNCLTREGYYRVRWIDGYPQYAVLEWDDKRTRLVAIDGQHRLSALKRFEHDERALAYGDFAKWRIPVVVVCFRSASNGDEVPRVLDVVRNIFVYINTEAKKVNEARQILLTDDSVNALCTQELLERSHSNDLMPHESRDSSVLPLLFFDWRGEERDQKRIQAPAAVKSVEEIYEWFRYYILGEDYSETQEMALGMNPTHPLHAWFYDNRRNNTRKLDHAASQGFRDLVNEEVLPAVTHVLENFIPFRSYAGDLRALENEYNGKSDFARHAFYELRFGTNPAMDANKQDVERILIDLKEEIDERKRKHLSEPFNRDIGMRGVMFAFGHLRGWLGKPTWGEYARWFRRALNGAYTAGWFDLDRLPGRDHLVQVAKDHNDAIINYRLHQVDDAIGAFVSLVVATFGAPLPAAWAKDEPAAREDCLERLEGVLRRGYKKQVRPVLKDDHPDGGKKLTDAVNVEAAKLAGRHIRRIEQALRKVAESADGHAEGDAGQ